jgi:predicted alpha/beta-hydrolase family hydrolase
MENPLVVYLAQGLAEAGYLTVRFNFPYKEKGKKGPDPQKTLVRTWQRVCRFVRENYGLSTVVAAGKSMGGRVASQAAADGTIQPDRLIFFGYPLHPPGKKDKLRDAHLVDLKTPMLFFAGTRDSLCDLGLLQTVLKKLTAPWKLEIVEGGDHSFNTPKSMNLNRQVVYDQILKKTIQWLAA